MPKKVFTELDREKQNRVIDAALREFAENGYVGGNTNRIVTECRISKGSLFKYFENKEELYFYLIDTVNAQRLKDMKAEINRLSKDLFERAIDYSLAEISWYINNPVKGRFIIGVASESDPEISRKITERYAKKSDDEFMTLMKDVDMSGFRSSRKEVVNILKWTLAGVNSTFLKNMEGKTDDLDKIRKEYVKQLKGYLKILERGL